MVKKYTKVELSKLNASSKDEKKLTLRKICGRLKLGRCTGLAKSDLIQKILKTQRSKAPAKKKKTLREKRIERDIRISARKREMRRMRKIKERKTAKMKKKAVKTVSGVKGIRMIISEDMNKKTVGELNALIKKHGIELKKKGYVKKADKIAAIEGFFKTTSKTGVKKITIKKVVKKPTRKPIRKPKKTKKPISVDGSPASMKVVELKAKLKDLGVRGYSKLNKAELVALLEEQMSGESVEEGDPSEKCEPSKVYVVDQKKCRTKRYAKGKTVKKNYGDDYYYDEEHGLVGTKSDVMEHLKIWGIEPELEEISDDEDDEKEYVKLIIPPRKKRAKKKKIILTSNDKKQIKKIAKKKNINKTFVQDIYLKNDKDVMDTIEALDKIIEESEPEEEIEESEPEEEIEEPEEEIEEPKEKIILKRQPRYRSKCTDKDDPLICNDDEICHSSGRCYTKDKHPKSQYILTTDEGREIIGNMVVIKNLQKKLGGEISKYGEEEKKIEKEPEEVKDTRKQVSKKLKAGRKEILETFSNCLAKLTK